MDLTALETAVRTRLGVPSTDALYTNTVLDALINASLHQFASEADFSWLEASETISTSNGTQNYSVNANARRTISIKSSSGVVLKETSLDELDWWGAPQGDPRLFAFLGSSIYVVPVPVTGTTPTLTHRYVRNEVDLSSGTDTPIVPTAYQQAIVEHAAYLAFRRAGNAQEAGAALAAYSRWVEVAKSHSNRDAASPGGGERDVPAVKA